MNERKGMSETKVFYEHLHWIPFDPELAENAQATTHMYPPHNPNPSNTVGPSHHHMSGHNIQAQATIGSSPEKSRLLRLLRDFALSFII